MNNDLTKSLSDLSYLIDGYKELTSIHLNSREVDENHIRNDKIKKIFIEAAFCLYNRRINNPCSSYAIQIDTPYSITVKFVKNSIEEEATNVLQRLSSYRNNQQYDPIRTELQKMADKIKNSGVMSTFYYGSVSGYSNSFSVSNELSENEYTELSNYLTDPSLGGISREDPLVKKLNQDYEASLKGRYIGPKTDQELKVLYELIVATGTEKALIEKFNDFIEKGNPIPKRMQENVYRLASSRNNYWINSAYRELNESFREGYIVQRNSELATTLYQDLQTVEQNLSSNPYKKAYDKLLDEFRCAQLKVLAEKVEKQLLNTWNPVIKFLSALKNFFLGYGAVSSFHLMMRTLPIDQVNAMLNKIDQMVKKETLSPNDCEMIKNYETLCHTLLEDVQNFDAFKPVRLKKTNEKLKKDLDELRDRIGATIANIQKIIE